MPPLSGRNRVRCRRSPCPRRAWSQHVAVCFDVCAVVLRRRHLPAWWMPLFVAQVRRHLWWDRPTDHHSPPLHPYSSPHSGRKWRMTYTRNVLPEISPPPTTSLSSSFHLIASFSLPTCFPPASLAIHLSGKVVCLMIGQCFSFCFNLRVSLLN